MIDIHILTYSGTKKAWLDQCLRSLERENCTVHVVQGEEGHVGAGRAKAYALGDHEFVGYVDSDDYVLPGVMDACMQALKTCTSVVTLEHKLWGSALSGKPQGGHHLTVYRREQLTPILPKIAEHPYLCDMLVVKMLKPTQLDYPGYVWRMHAWQAHRLSTREQYEAMEAACRS